MASCSFLDPLSCFGDAASSVAGDAFDGIARDFARAADATINWLWGELSSATAVHLGGPGFGLDLAIVGTITATVAVGLFVIQVVTSSLRRDPSGLARAGKGLLVAFIAGGLAIGVTNEALAAVDALSAGVVRLAMGTSLSGMGARLLGTGALLTVQNPAGMVLLSIAAIAAVVIVWFALMVRKVLIVVSAVFAPLAFAGSLADITVSWTRKWIEVMVALVFSKLILVMVFVVGWGVLEGGVGQAGNGLGQSLTQTVSGLLLLGVAGLSPWMALKLVHFSGEQFHALHGLAGSATAGAGVALSAPQKAAAWGSSAAGLASGGTSASGWVGSPSAPASSRGGSGGGGAAGLGGGRPAPGPPGPGRSGGGLAGPGLGGVGGPPGGTGAASGLEAPDATAGPARDVEVATGGRGAGAGLGGAVGTAGAGVATEAPPSDTAPAAGRLPLTSSAAPDGRPPQPPVSRPSGPAASPGPRRARAAAAGLGPDPARVPEDPGRGFGDG